METTLLVWRQPLVLQAVGLKKSALYHRIAAGEFPRPIPLGSGRAVGWLAHEVQQWLGEQVSRRDAGTTA